jgi:hypothetical protein
MKQKRKYAHYHPIDLTGKKTLVIALQCVAAGTANADQQRMVMQWLISDICMVEGLSFSPDSVRESDFAEGRRFVGLQLGKILRINVANYFAKEDKEKQNG